MFFLQEDTICFQNTFTQRGEKNVKTSCISGDSNSTVLSAGGARLGHSVLSEMWVRLQGSYNKELKPWPPGCRQRQMVNLLSIKARGEAVVGCFIAGLSQVSTTAMGICVA